MFAFKASRSVTFVTLIVAGTAIAKFFCVVPVSRLNGFVWSVKTFVPKPLTADELLGVDSVGPYQITLKNLTIVDPDVVVP